MVSMEFLLLSLSVQWMPAYVFSNLYCQYSTNVVFVSLLQTSPPSVPAPLCSSVTADAGIVTVVWSFTHTGGLELTNLTVHWFYIDGTFTNTSSREVAELSQNSLLVSGLEVGFVYTFSIEAGNELGSETAVCTPFTHSIGRYMYLYIHCMCWLCMYVLGLWFSHGL